MGGAGGSVNIAPGDGLALGSVDVKANTAGGAAVSMRVTTAGLSANTLSTFGGGAFPLSADATLTLSATTDVTFTSAGLTSAVSGDK
jgi:hypothetical protein